MEYDRSRPFLASVKERFSLCGEGSEKEVMHVVLDLEGSGIRYRVGDSIGVMPENPPILVERTLKALGCDGSEQVAVKGEQQSIERFFRERANLSSVPKKLVQYLLENQSDPEKRDRLSYLMEERDALKAYQESHEVWDALEENREVSLDPQTLCEMLQPLLPRLYSIASSMREVGEQAHLTIANVTYETNSHQRVGICTYYLCRHVPIGEKKVPVYIQPTKDFLLPSDPHVPIVMVGPGTGIAPFRAFMQERKADGNHSLNWLFFGDWNQKQHFFYRDYWQELAGSGLLRLDTAFSRDQEHKIYVQHRLRERGKELFEWLEKGACFYVCGDAQKMAKDVDLALHEIIAEQGKRTELEAKEYVKALRKEKRYLRDVY